MIYGFYFICKLKKHQIITNILEKAETLPSKVSVFCEKKESEKSSRKKMPKILFSCTSLVSTFIELSTNNVISILKSKVYDRNGVFSNFQLWHLVTDAPWGTRLCFTFLETSNQYLMDLGCHGCCSSLKVY